MSKKLLIIIITSLVILLGIAGGVTYYVVTKNNKEDITQNTDTKPKTIKEEPGTVLESVGTEKPKTESPVPAGLSGPSPLPAAPNF
jgi:flagellar basal body-associated protein FliL